MPNEIESYLVNVTAIDSYYSEATIMFKITILTLRPVTILKP